MKKIIKNPIFTFILGVISTLGITSALAYSILASNVGFTPTEELWDVENTDEALNDLHRIITTKTIDNYDDKTYTSEGLKVYDNRNTIVSGGYYIDPHNYVWVNITIKFNRTFTQGTWIQVYGFPDMGNNDFIVSDTTGKMAFRVHKYYPVDHSDPKYNRLTYVGQESEMFTTPTNTPITIRFKYLKGS